MNARKYTSDEQPKTASTKIARAVSLGSFAAVGRDSFRLKVQASSRVPKTCAALFRIPRMPSNVLRKRV